MDAAGHSNQQEYVRPAAKKSLPNNIICIIKAIIKRVPNELV